MTTVLYDTRWQDKHGIARFSDEVLRRLPPPLPIEGLDLLHPLEPLWLSWKALVTPADVYFSPGFNPPLWTNKPLVFVQHDIIHLRVPEENTARARAYYALVIRPAMNRAKFVLTVSEFSKREIVQWSGLPPEKVRVVSCGVDPAFRPEGPKHDPGFPYLLYVGGRAPHKNIPALLEAFARVADGRVKLMLSGRPDDDLRHDLLRLGLFGDVVFAGFIPDEDLPAYYRGALALAFPSQYEGFGLPALEAMACGTPVVTSNVTSLPEVVGDAAVLVDPHDVESIADGLRRVITNADLRADLRVRGLARAALFSWDRTAEAVRAALDEAAR